LSYMFCQAIAFIELFGAALLSFHAAFFGWLALFVLFAIAAFTSADIRRGFQRHEQSIAPQRACVGWRLAVIALVATCGILVITAGLFLILPRTARAAAMLFPGAPHIIGFSNAIDLGTFGQITKDNRPVMHILSYSR